MKKDRVVFMNALARPETETNVPQIIGKHYLKFNYAYDIIDYIESFSDIRRDIRNIERENIDDMLAITVVTTSGSDINRIKEKIEEYIEEHNGDVSAEVEVTSQTKLNISINTNFIEEDMYDEDRLNTD